MSCVLTYQRRPLICSVCGLPIDEIWPCRPHEPECPNYGQEVIDGDCDCDLVVHPDCCQECREAGVVTHRRLRWPEPWPQAAVCDPTQETR